MADGPIDYLSAMGGFAGLGDPFRSFINGWSGMQGIRANEQQLAKQQSELDDEAAYKQAVESVMANPNPQGFAALQARFGDRHRGIKDAFEIQDAAIRNADLRQMSEVYAAAQGGRWDIATTALRRRVEADRAAGQRDESDEQVLALLESGDPVQQRQALGMLGMGLSAIIGHDKFAQTYSALGKEQREGALHPLEMRRNQAQAATEEAEAAYAPEYYDARADNERAGISLKQAQTANYGSLMANRGREGGGRGDGNRTGSPSRTPTMAGAIAPLLAKMARGEPLTPAEQAAMAYYRPGGRNRSAGGAPAAARPSAPSGGPPRVRSLGEARSLPRGTVFIDPNGRTRVR